MRRSHGIALLILAAGIVVGLSTRADAQELELAKSALGCNATTYNVHSIIADRDSGSNPFQIQSDGGGAYPNSPSDTTVSYVGGFTCQFYLDTTNSTRTIGLTLAYPASSPATPPFAQAQVHAKVFSRCPNSSGSDIDWTTMALNVANECGSTIQFTYNGNSYNLSMNPNTAPGSTRVQVTCTGVNSSNNQCNMWSVTPIPGVDVNLNTGQSSAIAELVQNLKHGSKSLGFFYLAFSYTITNP